MPKFFGVNRQFDWLEILFVYDKSDRNLIIYGSYNVAFFSKIIQSVSIESFTEAYTEANKKNMKSITQHDNICYIDSLLCGAVMAA